MKFRSRDADVLRRILAWRRDVRDFLPTPVAEEIVERLRSAMALAPSVGNSRPWRVIRVENPALHAAVREEFERCNAMAAAAYRGRRRAAYQRLLLAGLDTAPLQLAVFTLVDPREGKGLGRTTMPVTLEQSTAMAIHTLWLAARAENLGLGMVSILAPHVMEQLFNLPPDWRFSAYLCLGYPTFEDDMPLLHRRGWQENIDCEWERR